MSNCESGCDGCKCGAEELTPEHDEHTCVDCGSGPEERERGLGCKACDGLMSPLKMLTVLDHIKGEVALIALHPAKVSSHDYLEHISDELRELAGLIVKLGE